jgi:hypothetical protein
MMSVECRPHVKGQMAYYHLVWGHHAGRLNIEPNRQPSNEAISLSQWGPHPYEAVATSICIINFQPVPH